MTFIYNREFRGPLEACIFDWAGTVLDFGCMAPAAAFVEVFERHQVPITVEEARGPMGAHKRVHIQEITEMAGVRQRWHDAHGRAPTDDDVETMYQEFIPLQLDCLADHSALIPGTLDVVGALRDRDMKIGTTTGYITDMTAINLSEAKKQGFEPDSTVCSNEVPKGRPFPDMCLQNAINLEVSSVQACVKVDDTVTGIEEGLNAGMWTVALTVSGNEVGLSLDDWRALPAADQTRLRAKAEDKMRRSGAHYVIDTVADLMPCMDDIQTRIMRGEKP